jgi:hypothetical protein
MIIEQNPRVDDPATPNTGAGWVKYYDRGAFEYQPISTGDITPPTVTLLSPKEDARVSGANVNVSAEAKDNVGVVEVQLFIDGKLTHVMTPADNNLYTSIWDTTIYTDGYHTLMAGALDAAGNAASDSIEVEVANANTLTFPPIEDATIRLRSPNRNYGSDKTIFADNSPEDDFLLKFIVEGVNEAQVKSAKLRLYCVNTSDKGGDFYRLNSNDWSEMNVTWNTAPAAEGPIIASLEVATSGHGWKST